jgi:hypothetical protein
MAKVRLHIEVSQELADILDGVAESEHVTRSEIVRRAITVLKACREQRAMGRAHLGFVKDARRLDAEILGIFNAAIATPPTLDAHEPVKTTNGEVPLAAQRSVVAPLPTPKSTAVSLEAVMSRWSPHTLNP